MRKSALIIYKPTNNEIIIFPSVRIFLLLCIPYEAESQSRSPVQDRRSIFRPTSQSRPPGGSRRPLQRSRRAMAMQYTGWEIGGNLGASYSLTDVSGNSVEQRPSFLNTQWSTVGLNAGVFGRYKFHPLFAVRVSVNYGKVHGADSLAEGRTRDFSFQNNIIELAATYEVYAPSLHLHSRLIFMDTWDWPHFTTIPI